MDAAASIEAVNEGLGASVRLSAGACLTAMRPGVPCAACAEVCPEEGAIRIAERAVRIDPAACSGCGRCTTACPTGAITAPGFGVATLYECARTRRAEAGARIVTCLGGIDAASLRAGLDVGDVSLIDRGWCETCPVSGGQAEPWGAVVAAVNAEAGVLRVAARVRVRRAPQARWRARAAPRGRSDNPARRALFARFAQAGQIASPADLLAGLPDKVAVPGLRRRASQLAMLAGDGSLPAALFPALAVRNRPRDMAVLARLCPTGALRVIETEAQVSLIFDATACIGCGDCTGDGALALAPAGEGGLDGPQVLIAQPIAVCTGCRARFSPRDGQSRCDGCARDTDLAALAHGLRRR